MKRIIVAGATILMALIMTAPSFAAMETKVTGTFTLDGILNLNPNMASDDDDKETVSFREMQLRINTETKINEKVTFFTRFDILDKILSSQFSNTIQHEGEDDDNIQFDHAWMRIISPVGVFQVGRKTGVKWGTDFFDDGNDYGTDRAEYILPIPVGDDKFIFGAVAEKALETEETNRDNDKFYLTGTYMSKEWKTGLLTGFYSYNSFVQEDWGTTSVPAIGAEVMNVGATGAAYQAAAIAFQANPTDPALLAAFQAAQAAYQLAQADFAAELRGYTPRIDGAVFYIAPYFSGKVGPINLNAEFGYITGEAQLKPDPGVMAAIAPLIAAGMDNPYAKKDVEAMCLWLEAGVPMGKANMELGYAYLSGDKDGFSGDIEYAGFLGQGEDWEKLFILTGDNSALDTSLGGDGNILEIGSSMNTAGINLMYLGGSYDITDNFSVNGIVGYATAAEEPAGYKDDYGTEVDLGLSWKFLGNLEYNATAAYLMVGDFWKGTTNAKVDDVISLYHELVLSF